MNTRIPANKRKWIWNRYKLTDEGWEQLVKSQGGVCAICGREEPSGNLYIDHDHLDGGIRGLLVVGAILGLVTSMWTPSRGGSLPH
jgi:hypothetical protein